MLLVFLTNHLTKHLMSKVVNREKITIYSAESSQRLFFMYLRDIISEFPQSHELGLRLFKRNLRALYRQSVLGMGWALLPPLLTAVVWIFLHSGNVVQINDAGIPYPVFVLTGTVLWQVFTEAVLAPVNQVIENRNMLTKMNIPRDSLWLTGLYQWTFNTVLKLGMLAIIFLYFGQPLNLMGFVSGVFGLACLALAGFSLGLMLSPLGVLFKDVERGLAIVLPFLMYLTPVVYAAPREGCFALLMNLNPLTVLLTQTRNWLTAQPVFDLPLFGLWTFVFVFLFVWGLVFYRLSMPMIIERIGA